MNIDELSDEELDLYIEQAGKRVALPSEHQVHGGAPRELWILMIVSGVIGMWASSSLLLSQLRLARDTSASLLCDINSLVGCSSVINSQYNNVFFGIPNALFGLMFFSGIVALGISFAAGARLRRWAWIGLSVGMVLAAVWLVWFQLTSVFAEKVLCPYCMLTWAATIPLVINVLARSAQAGHLGMSREATAVLVRGRWWIVLVAYVAVASVVVFGLWEKISGLF